MWLVLLLTVFWDLVTAVVIGVFLANVLTIKGQAEVLARSSQQVRGGGPDASHLDAQERELVERAGSDLLLGFTGPLSFGSSRYLAQLLDPSSDYGILVLDLSSVTHLGVTASLAIEALGLDAVQQERLRRLGLARNRAVQLVGSRREALQRAIGAREVIPPMGRSSSAPHPQEPPEGITPVSRPSATAAHR
jgi:SulP family sulfate permease